LIMAHHGRAVWKVLALISALTLSVLAPAAAGAVNGSEGAGLWESDYSPTDGFSSIDDDGSVALGVKFTTSTNVDVVGVRVYRVDSGAMTGTLWTGGGTQLATGSFGPFAPGWQDLTFGTPVAIGTGQTYVASYFAPNADYAYAHDFFAQSLTVGPITALDSAAAGGNGVYVYANSFPTATYKDSNYWVTPLWAYQFDGFYEPIDNDMWNQAKAGRPIPVKFSLTGYQGLDLFKAGYPKATQIACPANGEVTDPIEETATTAGGSSLTYDAELDQYAYVWKSNRNWANKCFQFELGLVDNTSHTFDLQFTK
jgi:hypothetical protein